MARETQPFAGGYEVDVATLAEELAVLPGIDGVTFSGGEPMAQAGPLVNLIDKVRAGRNLSFMAYTGYLVEELLRDGSPDQRMLLERLDILVDGPYIADRHTDLLWRGSNNQRVHLLSGRHRDLKGKLDDRGTWLEFELGPDNTLHWMGIPPRGFRQAFERHMNTLGIELVLEGGRHE